MKVELFGLAGGDDLGAVNRWGKEGEEEAVGREIGRKNAVLGVSQQMAPGSCQCRG